MLPTEIQKYLKKYSTGNWKLKTSNTNLYRVIIVVPVLHEYDGIKRLLESLVNNSPEYIRKTLIVFVVNNIKSVSNEVKQDNLCTLELLRNISDCNNINKFAQKIIYSGINIGIVDAASPSYELPEKDGGVGLARKIGMDLALYRFDYNFSKRNLLVCLDGDCTVENNYLKTLWHTLDDENIKAGYVKYEHELPDDEQNKLAIICYEIFLRYYVLGLNIANSPFAFHTIGSTLFCDVNSYVKIQGMNKRKAAEDFYFIEKLGKLTKIHEIKETRIYPSYRSSWRVPFGTGQRVNRFLSKERDEYFLYSFKSFLILKDWLKIFFNSENDSVYLLEKAKNIHPVLEKFLIEHNFVESWNKVLNETPNSEQLYKQKIFWFDGFRTLKLIHYLRDNLYPDEPMFDVVDEAFEFLKYKKITRDNSELIPSVDVQLKYLKILREFY